DYYCSSYASISTWVF
nr:immunoglobulin light chain junction region [Macaca mulatta]